MTLKRSPIKRKPTKPRKDANPAYLAWLRERLCAVWLHSMSGKPIHCSGIIEAAHVGQRGLGQKCGDGYAIPLCTHHHRTGRYAQHVIGKRFWVYWGIGREDVIEALHKLYKEETGMEV